MDPVATFDGPIHERIDITGDDGTHCGHMIEDMRRNRSDQPERSPQAPASLGLRHPLTRPAIQAELES